MRTLLAAIALAACILSAATPEKTAASSSIPDMSGVWQGPYTPDITKPLGHDLPYTALGAERFKNVIHADDPASYLACRSARPEASRRPCHFRLCNRPAWP